ncbi:efflux transporter outer membrane subunit [Acidithiobacillus sp. MC6.1]|uniref:RND transporter n=1 Tax=Acidithiobacillus ferrivorans TaxID=160808 RepID=A0A1B9BWM6_9PROT|nr:efflux transporter outer membrane subunit [Acidithiobacillus ferrivorans]MBN6739384.1 efflux transporter outer membrane subunit [Acidithiobacillus sp. MC6.1]OCB02084.1 RND transporter [Acidithiobacillus ferrivorans]
MKRSIALILSLLLLGACARLPQHLPGDKMAHDTQISGTLAQLDGHAGITPGAWPASNWWESAQLPALNNLISEALRNNPSLQATSARILEAKAAAANQHATLLPHFSAGAAVTQEHFSRQGLHAPLNGKTITYGVLNPLEMRYHLDLWGRDNDHFRASLGEVRVHQADYAEAKLLLSTRLAWHYFLLAGDVQRFRQVAHAEALHSSLLHLEQQRWHDGLSSARTVYLQEVARARVRQSAAEIQAAIAQQRYILAALAGHGPDWGRDIPVEPLPTLSTINIPRNLPLRLIAHRPDIVAARWEIEVAAQQMGAARAAFYPDVNIALFTGWNSIHLGDLFSPGNLADAIGPVISLPIFEGGRLRAHLREQNALYIAVKDHYRATILDAVREVAGRLAIWRQTRQEIRGQRQMILAAEHTTTLAESTFHSGMTNKAEAYIAQIQETQIKNQLLALETKNAQSWVLLHAALGGGYTPRKNPA